MRARRSSELNLLKVEPIVEEKPVPEEDDGGGCDMCSSWEPERDKTKVTSGQKSSSSRRGRKIELTKEAMSDCPKVI